MAVNEKGGIKYNEGKPKLSDMMKGFWESLIAVSEVYNFGAMKHGLENWKLVHERDYIDAALRHWQEINKSNDYSEEVYQDKTYTVLHAAQLAWNGLALCWFALQRKKEKELLEKEYPINKKYTPEDIKEIYKKQNICPVRSILNHSSCEKMSSNHCNNTKCGSDKCFIIVCDYINKELGYE